MIVPLPTLVEFLDGPEDRAWTKQFYLRAFVRRSDRRVLHGSRIPTLEVADVTTVADRRLELRGFGCFCLWLVEAEEEADRRGALVVMERVLDRRLWGFLLRRGYLPVEGSAETCAWRPVSQRQERRILEIFLDGPSWRHAPTPLRPEERDAVLARLAKLEAQRVAA